VTQTPHNKGEGNGRENLVVVLLGAPGAGKGTQGELLARLFGLDRLSTGDLLRREIASSSDLGRLAHSYMSEGSLVPDDVILSVMKHYFARHPDSGVLLDGFPRTVAQAEGLEHLIDGRLMKVVSIDVPERMVIQRLSLRRVCRSCGRLYNPATTAMPVDLRCDCGGVLYQRDDDRLETITRRLQVYHHQTEPLIEFYNRRGSLVKVDGSGSPDEVFAQIQAQFA